LDLEGIVELVIVCVCSLLTVVMGPSL